MKRYNKYICSVLTICILAFSNFAVFAQENVNPTPFAYGTSSTSNTKTKTLSSSKGNLKISYTISGLYVYDLNSGAITRAYDGKLKEVNLISAPNDGDWELIIQDVVISTPIIASDGSYAKYPVRFHVYARFVPGGVGFWDPIDFGIINDYAMAYAE